MAVRTSGVAVIPIHGTLVRRTVGLEAESGLTSYTQLAAQLDAALANPEVAAILLDIDSPGGESGGVFDLADRIRAATQVKPVWAVANDMAFSAAYALASAASKVFVSRTGGVGSIGVIAMHVDQSEKDAQDGVRYTAVFAGDRKNDLTPHAPISNEAHAFLQAEVNRIYSIFVETVARNRGLAPSTVQGAHGFHVQRHVRSPAMDDCGAPLRGRPVLEQPHVHAALHPGAGDLRANTQHAVKRTAQRLEAFPFELLDYCGRPRGGTYWQGCISGRSQHYMITHIGHNITLRAAQSHLSAPTRTTTPRSAL